MSDFRSYCDLATWSDLAGSTPHAFAAFAWQHFHIFQPLIGGHEGRVAKPQACRMTAGSPPCVRTRSSNLPGSAMRSGESRSNCFDERPAWQMKAPSRRK